MSMTPETWPNKPAAANPAIASRLHVRRLWRGVAEPERSAASTGCVELRIFFHRRCTQMDADSSACSACSVGLQCSRLFRAFIALVAGAALLGCAWVLWVVIFLVLIKLTGGRGTF